MLTFNDILLAQARLKGVTHRTPVLTSRQFDEHAGGTVFFKAENLQRAGAFKIRGAYNKIASLSAAQRAGGIISHSSGNHAQGVALAAQLLGVRAVVVMPADAPPIKVTATRGYGAEVVFYDRYTENREAVTERIRAAQNLTLVPPFDDYQIMAGQGTVALELLADVPDLDFLLVPTSGAGLLAGCATAAKHLRPSIRVFGVEPEAGDDTRQSLHRGERIEIPVPKTIADGLQVSAPGKLTFPLVQALVEDILLVSDAELIATMRFMLERMKVLVEPSGAAGAAAVFQRKFDFAGRRVGVVLSGGNVDLAKLADYLRAESA